MIRCKFEENESLYYKYAEQFLGDCQIFQRLPPIKKYAIRYADQLKLETGPFWEIVKRVIEDRVTNERRDTGNKRQPGKAVFSGEGGLV